MTVEHYIETAERELEADDLAKASEEFHRRLNELYRHAIRYTPVRQTAFITGNFCRVKHEDEQPFTRTFKSRGAMAAFEKLDPKERDRGVVTVSAGNHAQGVALAAKVHNSTAIAVMPEGTPQPKQNGVRALGGKVVLAGTNFEEAAAFRAQEYPHLPFIPPFDDPNVIAGQGTVACEILAQIPEVEYIGVAVGGGGLLAGVGSVVQEFNRIHKRNVKVIGFEPESAACVQYALDQGEAKPLPNQPSTIAEGAAVRQAGCLPFKIIEELHTNGVLEVHRVPELDLVAGIVELHEARLEEACLLAELHNEDPEALAQQVRPIEGAGVLPFVGMRQFLQTRGLAQKHVAIVASGGNMSLEALSSLRREHKALQQQKNGPMALGGLGVLRVLSGPTALLKRR